VFVAGRENKYLAAAMSSVAVGRRRQASTRITVLTSWTQRKYCSGNKRDKNKV